MCKIFEWDAAVGRWAVWWVRERIRWAFRAVGEFEVVCGDAIFVRDVILKSLELTHDIRDCLNGLQVLRVQCAEKTVENCVITFDDCQLPRAVAAGVQLLNSELVHHCRHQATAEGLRAVGEDEIRETTSPELSTMQDGHGYFGGAGFHDFIQSHAWATEEIADGTHGKREVAVGVGACKVDADDLIWAVCEFAAVWNVGLCPSSLG
jgi:hypothetical protein